MARVVAPGVPHHVTQRGNRRQQVFFSDDDYETYRRMLAEGCRAAGVKVLAYCLMPNHWHMLLRPRKAGQLGRFMQRLTLTHTRRWQEHYHLVGSLPRHCVN